MHPIRSHDAPHSIGLAPICTPERRVGCIVYLYRPCHSRVPKHGEIDTMQKGCKPLKSKGLRDSSLFSSVVLIVEKSRLSWESRRMGAYQHTKPNGHTILEMNRVTVQWERVIVYQESCDSRLLQSKRPFFGPFWPDVPPTPRRSGLCSTRADEGQQRRTCCQSRRNS